MLMATRLNAKKAASLTEQRAKEIEALVHYATPIHMQPAAASLNLKPSDFPQTLQLSKRILSLPLYPGMTLEQQDFIVRTIAKFYKS